ncbi:hypothetical protein MLD38_012440 [Melastoma candidum]|uniref:Uncharacterized protein n=1 Tax=Melastoma candidum TaxID=119954 RepID=A0ACB9R7M6_9MYRT|nr:hypothetical protein MLD38_012440 [Melastoma candidum]
MSVFRFSETDLAYVLTTSIILAFVFTSLRKRKRGTSKFPPGRKGWPLVGDTFEWFAAVASPHPPRFVEQQSKRFGKVFSCSLLGKWVVVSVDPGFNHFVMQNEGRLFRSSYPKSFRDLVGRNGVITAQAEQQKRLHGIASNMMRAAKLRSHFLRDIQLVMLENVCRFRDGQLLVLQDACRKVAINLMVNQLLGITSESEINEMSRLFSDFVDGCLSFPINLPFFAYHTAMKVGLHQSLNHPIYHHHFRKIACYSLFAAHQICAKDTLGTITYTNHVQAREKIVNKIVKTIESRRIASRGEVGNGVLGRLVDEENLPNEAVSDFIINMIFAGNETTAKTMLFATYFLTHCPKALEHLQEEHEKLKKGEPESLLSWEDYEGMNFTQCVIDETLRLGGIAIWLMREATQEVTYEDYVIPKGCFVVPFLSAVHLDENIYDRALEFDPWRWMDPKNKEKRNWRNSHLYTPFGGGARLCPGAELARLQIAMFLHYFLTSCRWTQLKEDRRSFFPSARLVNGFQILLNRRE